MQNKVQSNQKIYKNKANSQFEFPKRLTTKICNNHPDKKGKYQCIPQNEQLKSQYQKNYYCSKCAIQYAAKNFNITDLMQENKIEPNQIKNESHQLKIENINNFDQNQRNQIIQQLQQSIIQTLKDCEQNKQSIISRRGDVQYFYDNQILKLDKTYDQIQYIIEQVKIKQLSYIKNQAQISIQQFQQIEQNLDQNINRMQLFIDDIEQNISNQQINQIDNKPFKQVVKQQQDNLNNYNNYNKDLHLQQINTDTMLSSKEIELILQNISKIINEAFQFKKQQRNIIKQQNNNEFIHIDQQKGHEKNNSDYPKNIIFKNEEEKKNTIEIIKQAKKKSLTELSPIVNKEGYRRDLSNHSQWGDKENLDNTNRNRSKTPTNKNFEDLKRNVSTKIFNENVMLTPTNKDFKNFIKKNQS